MLRGNKSRKNWMTVRKVQNILVRKSEGKRDPVGRPERVRENNRLPNLF
jgi:hypothetical protein